MAENTLSPTPSLRTRRRALTFAAGGFASIGLTAGVVATVADVTMPGSDAELIRLCGEFDAHERTYQAICSGAPTLQQEEANEALLDAVRGRQEPLLDRICSLPVATSAGLAALAASLLLWEADRYIEEDDPDLDTNERLLAALLRGVMGWVAA